jgi:hypothetical protein
MLSVKFNWKERELREAEVMWLRMRSTVILKYYPIVNSANALFGLSNLFLRYLMLLKNITLSLELMGVF